MQQLYEDPKLYSKIKESQEKISKISESRAPIALELDFKKMDRYKFSDYSQDWMMDLNYIQGWAQDLNQFPRQLDFFEQILQKLTSPSNWEKQVNELRYELIHVKGRRVKERNIFNQLNHLMKTKEVVDGEQSKEKSEIIERWGSEERIREHIQIMKRDYAISKQRLKVAERKALFAIQQKTTITNEVQIIRGKLTDLNKQKAMAHECILETIKQVT